MARAKVTPNPTTTLYLSEEEAQWLKGHLQNFHGDVEDEEDQHADMRKAIFSALSNRSPDDAKS